MTEPDDFDRRLSAAGNELRAASGREPSTSNIHRDLRSRRDRLRARRAVGAGLAAALVAVGGAAWSFGVLSDSAPDHEMLASANLPRTTASTPTTTPDPCDGPIPTGPSVACASRLGPIAGPVAHVAITVTQAGQPVPDARGWLLSSGAGDGTSPKRIPFVTDAEGRVVVELPAGPWTVHAARTTSTATSEGSCRRTAVGQAQVKAEAGLLTPVSVPIRVEAGAPCATTTVPASTEGG